MAVRLSVVTVTYNSQEYIKDCLGSVLKELGDDDELIVVDNSSMDKTLQLIPEDKKIRLINSSQNLGFAKACNIAAKEAKGNFLLFLNPDVRVEKGAIQKLLTFLQNKDDCGVVAPKLVDFEGQTQRSVRNLPTFFRAFQEYYLGIKRSYESYAPVGDGEVVVEVVFGAAILLRKSVFEKIGGFDERYFMYFEDVALCREIRKLGLKVYYLPSSVVEHKVGGSISDNKKRWSEESTNIYHGKTKAYLLHLLIRISNYFKKLRGLN